MTILFPQIHLEDKVKLAEASNVMDTTKPLIKYQYARRGKMVKTIPVSYYIQFIFSFKCTGKTVKACDYKDSFTKLVPVSTLMGLFIASFFWEEGIRNLICKSVILEYEDPQSVSVKFLLHYMK